MIKRINATLLRDINGNMILVISIAKLLCIQHFLVDAICLACIFGLIKPCFESAPAGFICAVALYNALAFCTQWLTGLCCDMTENNRYSHLIYSLLLLIGCAVSARVPLLGIFLIGTGNSIFHAAGGKYVIEHAAGKAGPLGCFVAPGALGVYAGTMFCNAWLLFSGLMLINALVLYLHSGKGFSCGENQIGRTEFTRLEFSGIILVLICILCRAASGSIQPAWNSPFANLTWLPVLLVFCGKLSGGFLGDFFGVWKTGTAGLVIGTLLVIFGNTPTAFCAGTFCMNLLMALTLWQLVRFLPGQSGFAFGLAASMLYPGSLIRLPENSCLGPFLLLLGCIVCFTGGQHLLNKQKERAAQ